jgi:hypothetical protein
MNKNIPKNKYNYETNYISDKYDLAFKKNIKKINISEKKNDKKETEEFIMDSELFPEINTQIKINENIGEPKLDFKSMIQKKVERDEIDNVDNEYENLKPGWMLIKGDRNNYGKIITKFKPLQKIQKKEVNEMEVIAKILVDKWDKYKQKYEEINGEGSYDEYYNECYKNLPYDIPDYNFDDIEDYEDDEEESIDNNSYNDDYDEYD